MKYSKEWEALTGRAREILENSSSFAEKVNQMPEVSNDAKAIVIQLNNVVQILGLLVGSSVVQAGRNADD